MVIFKQACSFINTLGSCLTWQTYRLQPPSISFLILPSQYSSFKACIPKWRPCCTQCTFASHNYSLIITDTKNVIFSPFDILKTYDHFLIWYTNWKHYFNMVKTNVFHPVYCYLQEKHGFKSVKIERKQKNQNVCDIDQLQLRVQVF